MGPEAAGAAAYALPAPGVFRIGENAGDDGIGASGASPASCSHGVRSCPVKFVEEGSKVRRGADFLLLLLEVDVDGHGSATAVETEPEPSEEKAEEEPHVSPLLSRLSIV